MAKTFQSPAGIEIAALKEKVVFQGNLMQPGPGTAWEDRGAIGLPKALILTCIRAMSSPVEQWEQIRRPETTGDATAFVLIAGALSGISWVVHSLWWPRGTAPLVVNQAAGWTVDWQVWAIGSALQMACAISGMWLLVKFANYLYQKLLPHGIAAKIPPALTYNLLAYSLGPVLLVFVPVVGWMIGLVWFTVLMMLFGMRRLRIPLGAAVINSILTVLITTVIAGGLWLAGDFAWGNITDTATSPPPPVLHTPGFQPGAQP